MQQYLVHLTLSTDQHGIRERVLSAATSFLGMQGAVERVDIGRCARPTKAGNLLHPFDVTIFTLPAVDDAVSLAHELEGALQGALKTVKLKGRLVRVFIVQAHEVEQ